MAGKVILPNSFYNRLFLGKDRLGKFKPIPDKITSAVERYIGTAGVIGSKDRPLGKYVETVCRYSGNTKTVVFKSKAGQKSLVDTMLLCDHGFASDGTPLIQLFNARTNKPICTKEEMLGASEVLVKFNGTVHQIKIRSREGGIFEKVGDESTRSWIYHSAVLGLLARGCSLDPYGMGRRDVDLFGDGYLHTVLGVAVESPKVAHRKKSQV